MNEIPKEIMEMIKKICWKHIKKYHYTTFYESYEDAVQSLVVCYLELIKKNTKTYASSQFYLPFINYLKNRYSSYRAYCDHFSLMGDLASFDCSETIADLKTDPSKYYLELDIKLLEFEKKLNREELHLLECYANNSTFNETRMALKQYNKQKGLKFNKVMLKCLLLGKRLKALDEN